MPRLSPATTARRRARIVDAAVRCFFRDGLAATSVDAICAEAGISKGALYVHFPSKEAVFEAVLEQRISELGDVGGETVEALADSVFERQIAPTMVPANGRFGLELIGASAADQIPRARMNANLAQMRERIAAAVTALRETGAARRDCDPEGVAAIVETFVLGAVSRYAMDPAEPAEALRVRTRRLIGALIAPAP